MKTPIILIASKLNFSVYLLFLFINTHLLFGQNCESTIMLQLLNIDGGVFSNQKVTLKNKGDGKIYNMSSDVAGKVSFTVPCSNTFTVTISNYTDKYDIKSPHEGTISQMLSYEANMAEKVKLFAMSPAEIAKVDETAMLLPDTIFIKGSRMAAPLNRNCFALINISLKDIKGLPLTNESIILTGARRNKSVKGVSDNTGKMSAYLPKGDTYSINFKYNKDYSSVDYKYSKGSSETDLSLDYLGTKEIEKRKKAEALRIIEEEKRLKKERELFEADCKRQGITVEEGYRREMRRAMYGTSDTVVVNVLNRNKWINKLIVCDLTGSMQPYASQLSIWYQLNYKKEPSLQFVFFNDGDNMADNRKIIGQTGGIYYSPSKGIDSLVTFAARVSGRGSGGDCPENNMEALIKGVKMAKPYNELIMIVDNNAPVKDISLLKDFNKPVHIILCGAADGWVLLDYLLIAWKTKGSIHTMEQDITKIAQMSEGEEIKIGNAIYRIMGGEFVRIYKG